MTQMDDDMPETLRRLAARAIEPNALNLTEEERIAVATELYRLADAITAEPTTPGDKEAKQQALRRVAWLTQWMQRAIDTSGTDTTKGSARQ
jgi:hypothetical protein